MAHDVPMTVMKALTSLLDFLFLGIAFYAAMISLFCLFFFVERRRERKKYLRRTGLPEVLLPHYIDVLSHEPLLDVVTRKSNFVTPMPTNPFANLLVWSLELPDSIAAQYWYKRAIKRTRKLNAYRSSKYTYLAPLRIQFAMQKVRIRPLNESEQSRVLYNPEKPYEFFVIEVDVPPASHWRADEAMKLLESFLPLGEEIITLPRTPEGHAAYLISRIGAEKQ